MKIIDWILIGGILAAIAGLVWAFNYRVVTTQPRDYAAELAAKIHRPVEGAICRAGTIAGHDVLICRAILLTTIDGRAVRLPFTGALPR